MQIIMRFVHCVLLYTIFIIVDCCKGENKQKFDIPISNLVYDEQDQELYISVFGESHSQKEVLLEFNTLLDGEKIGELEVLVGSKCKVFANSLKELLAEYIVPETLKKIDNLKDEQGFILFEKLSSLSIDIKLNKLTLQLEIVVDLKIKKKRNFGKYRKTQIKQNVKQAMFSAFLNTRVAETMYRGEQTYNNRFIVLNHALNVSGLVMEGELSQNYLSNSKEGAKFYRDYTTLTYNFPESDSFIKLGDVFCDSRRYQSIPKLLGIKIQKGAESAYEEDIGEILQITLLRTSSVSIYINNNLVKRMENVAPGTYTIDDIAIPEGSNDIKIKIIDDTGREQVLDKSFFLKKSFIAQGKFAFSLSCGYPQSEDFDNGRYDKKNKVFAGSVIYGLFSATELEFGTQKSQVGKSYTFALRNQNVLGSFDIQYACSQHNNENIHLSGKAYYLYYATPSIKIGERSRLGFRVSTEKSDSFFYPYLRKSQISYIGSFLKQRENRVGKNINHSYSLFLNDICSININLNYSFRKNAENKKNKSFSCNIYKYMNFHDSNYFKSANINCFFEKTTSFDNKVNKIFGISCSISLNENKEISFGSERRENNWSSYASIFQHPYCGNGFGYDISVSKNANSKNYNLKTDYTHPAFKVDLSHSNQNGTNNTTIIGGETTFFFADGNFAIGRNNPNDGGFVIAVPENVMKKETLSFLDGQIESNIFGGAVIPIARKNMTVARLDLTNLSENLEVKQDTIIAYGEYKRGSTVKISADGNIIVKGKLYDSNEEPLKLVTGYAIHETDPDAKPLYFFTNISGRFIITNLKQGKYKVFINIEGMNNFEIEVKESNGNAIDLGSIICEEQVNNE